MAELPIVCSGTQVRAIIDGRQTQIRKPVTHASSESGTDTRRKAWPMHDLSKAWVDPGGTIFGDSPYLKAPFREGPDDNDERVYRIYSRISRGDRLWVRETFIHYPAEYEWSVSTSVPYLEAHTVYRASVDNDGSAAGVGWKPPIHMPRDLSRITLEVTGVRVERVQDIDWMDSLAEGVPEVPRCGCYGCRTTSEMCPADASAQVEAFAMLWEATYPGSWERNEWVWVIDFKREVTRAT